MLIDEFLISRCESDPHFKTSGGSLYDAYDSWVFSVDETLIPMSRRRFMAAVIQRSARYEVRYGAHRFEGGAVARGFAGMRLLDVDEPALPAPTHVSVSAASHIAGYSTATICGWVATDRLRDTVRVNPRKMLISLASLHAYLGVPPTRLPMAETVLPLLTGTSRDLLRAAVFAPHNEWADRLRRLLDALKDKNDPRLGMAITLLENIT